MVQVPVSAVMRLLEVLFSSRYTTPPLPRVIKGSEWQQIITKLRELCRDKKDSKLDDQLGS